MRAITVTEPGGPQQLQWSEVPTPSPAEGEVLVKTIAVGVNRADLLQRQGHYPPPRGISDVMGLEATGTVAELGKGVTGMSVGDEVVCLLAGGAYAEYFVVPTGQCIAVPQGVDVVTAAGLVEVAATVVSNMDGVGLEAGETLLVHGGAGGIGTFAIQYAKALGCRVLTTAGSKAKLEHCRAMGADVAIDYHDDWVAAVKEATDGQGADVILDVMGAKYLELNVDALATAGRLVIIGMQGGVKGTLNIGKLLSKRALVTATSLRFRPVEEKVAICQRVAEVVWPMIADGRIKPAPETRIPLKEARRAHEQLAGGENIGKIILVA
ncbi:putative PIG3 family NAD(P)H quinone oxidoreductase [Luteococcus japonicus]|uniref:Quinone oxidoreductase n=2 Tax=Luteococcus japonicus TaxID=33984 RepID=A0A1R4KAH8_9ACTN|nr:MULTISPECIES: NAD(P)H-quinone oxidoreductase [Luteococcus]MDN5563891.1 NAD(P)H-quinone oxidoreductase [Luteococcus sp.]ROR54496.1 putative PIG3 family NAD(P)H quinone oxidoreductase [Luteococcus japonicus]SJN41309.1 Quinone oxidoreductase [Luteococcus japonicus LSP_Lj1]